MQNKQRKIALMGECMLELSRQSTGDTSDGIPMNLSYGGDTLSSAVYLARLGVPADYITALGDDPMSKRMVEQWRREGVGCDLVEYFPASVPGMYLIETDDMGERSFYYWRDSAPARRLLDDENQARQLFQRLENHGYLALSGITLAIYSESSRQRLFELLAEYRSKGGKVIFDGNYRPKLWLDKSSTRKAYEQMYRLTDIALPTIEDEQELFDEIDQQEIVQRLQAWSVGNIILKMGEQGCLVVNNEGQEMVPANKVRVVDTTSAGDSFNAGYLAALIKGQSATEAARSGHRLASVVIQHKGAIIPASAMPQE